MLGHIGVNVPELDAAKAYYGEIMPLVGFEQSFAAEDEFAFMPSGGKRGTFLFFWVRCCIVRRRFRSIHLPITPPSGWTLSASCSKPSATTTASSRRT
jgi:hypothetical protein